MPAQKAVGTTLKTSNRTWTRRAENVNNLAYRKRRGGRVAEGARLESVFRVKPNVGSNPTLSAILLSGKMKKGINRK
jgi:hypothetical protein